MSTTEKHVAEMSKEELVERFKSCHPVWKSWEVDGSFDDKFKSWRADIQIDIDEWHEEARQREIEAQRERARIEAEKEKERKRLRAERERELAGPWIKHVMWCKERAFDLLNRCNDPQQALMSINNDLTKHPDAKDNPLLVIVMLETQQAIMNGCKVEDVRNVIDRIGGYVPTDFKFDYS